MSKWAWLIIGVAIALGIVGLSIVILNPVYYYSGSLTHGYLGMMNWVYGGSGLINNQGYYGYSYGIYSIKQALNMVSAIPPYAHVYPSNNTIVFSGSSINLVVVAMMGDDAAKMFNATPPSYAHGDVFIIYGLINPTIVVPSGSVMHILFINLDDDMYHNFVVTVAPPPYPYNVMPYVAMSDGMGPQMMLNMRWLPPANYHSGYAYGYEYTIAINEPGIYWYICTYPGHASNGMYGELVVR
ncbi:plastocyanin/azurin family copper-binding protein [Caldivirga sp.]|uniref:plastocyanin/azurin family copper-binding protein n=1 Tax=Caldivirga sp. TaxID=2080243 RepID=UPI0025BB7A78|nr:plastocyanin/azurin family copper-binding protein [Caldivirga sp.]